MIKYCECGSIIIDGKCSNERCGGEKQKGHYIYGMWFDFNTPVTRQEATVMAEEIINAANDIWESEAKGE